MRNRLEVGAGAENRTFFLGFILNIKLQPYDTKKEGVRKTNSDVFTQQTETVIFPFI